MKSNEVVLIITGCIKPDVRMSNLTIRDEKIRLEQYRNSWLFYINEPSVKNIVICDNSLYPYSFKDERELAKRAKKNLEIISHIGDVSKSIERGKGYGEGELLRYVFENSQLVQCRTCIKVTGRLIISNISDIIKRIKAGNIYMNQLLYNGDIDTRLFIVPYFRYMESFLKIYENVNDEAGKSIENVFANNVIGIHYRNIPCYPFFYGYSGSAGIKYENEGNWARWAGNLFCTFKIYNFKWSKKVLLRLIYYNSINIKNKSDK